MLVIAEFDRIANRAAVPKLTGAWPGGNGPAAVVKCHT
jgi:hypothetical protein